LILLDHSSIVNSFLPREAIAAGDFFVPRRRPLEVFVHKSSRRAFQARADAACGQTMLLVEVTRTFAFRRGGTRYEFFGEVSGHGLAFENRF
jgi:hypothetical protein